MTRRRFHGIGALLLLVCAAAAGLAVVLARANRPPPPAAAPPGPPPPADRADLPALPPYIINVALGPIDLTAPATGPRDLYGPPLIVSPGEPLEIVVRPESAVTEKVTVRLFWRKQDRLRRWRPPYERGPHSTYRYRGPGERPFGRGPGQIVAVVSPVEDVPDDPPAHWLAAPPKHWRILRQSVRWK